MGLNPAGVTFFEMMSGRIPEWPNGADCKSAGCYLRWFESISAHFFAAIAQLVEHDLAKVGVASSSLVCRSLILWCVSSAWLEYMPVTHGVTGSSPVRTAKVFFMVLDF